MKTVVIGSSTAVSYKDAVNKCMKHRNKEIDFFISLAGGSPYYAGLSCNLINSYMRRDSFISGEHLTSAGIFYTMFFDPDVLDTTWYGMHPVQNRLNGRIIVDDSAYLNLCYSSTIGDIKPFIDPEVYTKFKLIYDKLWDFSRLCFEYMIECKMSSEALDFCFGEYSMITVGDYYRLTPEELFLRFKVKIDQCKDLCRIVEK